jgi:hypothetical protein
MARLNITYSDIAGECPQAVKKILAEIGPKVNPEKLNWKIMWIETGGGWELPQKKKKYPTVEEMLKFRLKCLEVISLGAFYDGDEDPSFVAQLSTAPSSLINHLRQNTKEEVF